MKLIRQSRLYYKEGTSDKMYETDLCQTGAEEYVVNFRFGRRGSRLSEGTRTVFPVPRAEAEKIFNKLILSKTRKGYRESLPEMKIQTKKTDIAPTGKEDRDAAILARLKAAAKKKPAEGSEWPLSRILWRAGELKLEDAVPFLVQLTEADNDMERYCLVWALGRCASPGDSEALQALDACRNTPGIGEHILRMAAAAILKLHPDDDTVPDVLLNGLPEELSKLVLKKDADGLKQQLMTHLFDLKTTSNDYLTMLYLLSERYTHIRQVLWEILFVLPLKPPFFQPVRHIFKLAEFREDHEIYGLLAYRFELSDPFLRRGSYGYSLVGNEYINTEKEYLNDPPKTAYSDRTRNYLIRRIIRTLERTGHAGDAEAYTGMAAAFLLMFSDDEDKNQPHIRYEYSWDQETWESHVERIHHDSYSGYLIFCRILYAESARYLFKAGGTAWQCIPPYEPGQPAPADREEAFPELWEKAPEALLKLLCESRAERVHEFAAKAFRAVPDFSQLTDASQLIAMFMRPYEVTNRLALELALSLYSPVQPDISLVLAMLECPLGEARRKAKEWAEAQPKFFFGDADFVSRLILSPEKDIRSWMRSRLPVISLTDSQQQTIISRVISALMSSDSIEAEIIRDAGETLQLAFPDVVYRLGPEVLRDLLNHPAGEIQMTAARILMNHRTPPEMLPEELFTALLNADSPPVRALGVQLFGRLKPSILLEKRSILMNLCISEYQEVREAVRPVIARLIQSNKEFAEELTLGLIPAFLFKEAYEGVHNDLFILFTEQLNACLDKISQKKMWRLIRSKHSAANRLGAVLINLDARAADVAVEQAVELSRHELLALRQSAWKYYQGQKDRIRSELSDALSILDSDWEDTRQFAFEYFRTAFSDEDWTPDLLAGLCDSVREDVQKFGREMITRFFKEEHGTEYLVKLSQHPSADVQLFAANYLERFAGGHIDRFEQLLPYFTTVLSQVNRGRTAKDRIFKFIRDEAMKNESAARMTAELLKRQSLTVAVGDRSTCIEMMRDIQAAYPHIDAGITVKAVRTYEKDEAYGV